MEKFQKEIHEILSDVEDTLVKKNTDYGFSFHKSVDEYGLMVLAIRLEDKINRLKQLIKYNDAKVAEESIEDTLKDINGYSVLGLHYLNYDYKNNK